ncbi:MAG: hypothetical protein J5I59_13820 [Saprospiraceae bacterium]|nr:hypothetical protein [Saprospiraceae bacterium]
MKYLPTLLAEHFAKGFNIKLSSPDNYTWDYGLVYPDGSNRFQYVYLSEFTEKEKDYLYIRSFVADYDDRLNPTELLREADYGRMSFISIKPYTKSDGTKTEGVYVTCCLPAAVAENNKQVFIDVIHEIANKADYLEKKFLNVDN